MDAKLDLPAGWTASPSTPTTIGTLAPEASQQLSWKVTIPVDATQGSYAVAAVVGYRQEATSQTTGASYQLSVIPKGRVYISDLPFRSATNGYGPVERDMSVGAPMPTMAARSASTALAMPRARHQLGQQRGHRYARGLHEALQLCRG